MTLAINNDAVRALWAAKLAAEIAKPSFFESPFIRKAPKRKRITPAEAAEQARKMAIYRAQLDADTAKVPAFLSALHALCNEHGVSFKAEVGDIAYEGDLFEMYLGHAQIVDLNIVLPEPTGDTK